MSGRTQTTRLTELPRRCCSAFYFFSQHKSFILLAASEEEKLTWIASIRENIARSLRGPTSSRRASIRSELLVNEDEVASDYELEGAFVIKNGWLNVTSAETVSAGNGSGRRPHRLWISLTLQSLSLSAVFKAAQPDESISIELCEAAPMRESTFFRLVFVSDEVRLRLCEWRRLVAVDSCACACGYSFEQIRGEKKTYVFEAQTLPEREEWLRALTHCISGNAAPHALDLRRQSINNATLAPVFMFNKVSNVCTICYHPFAVYRPRHHCRYVRLASPTRLGPASN